MMTLPTVPPIGMIEIQDEFLAPLGTPLSAFLRGGVWVPDSAANAGVPTALPIAMTDLLGADVTAGELFDMLAGVASQGRSGYIFGTTGSINPDIYRTFFIDTMRYRLNPPSSNIEFRLDQTGLLQSFFARITIVGPGWNEDLLTADADSFDPNDAGRSTWRWDTERSEFLDATNYAITLFE